MSFVQNTADKAKAWGQSLFTIDPNATPEQIERKRQLIAAMMPRGDAKYVGSGLADLAKGVALGVKGRRMDKFEGEKRKEASDAFRGALGQVPAPQGPLSVLGMNPDWGAEQSFVQQPEAAASEAPFTITPGVAPGASETWGRDALLTGLTARGIPEHIAEGFAMNFQDESGLNPGINEENPIVAGSRGGYGLAQWTGPRRRQLEAFAEQRGVPVSDPDLQMDFLVSELQGPEASAWSAISQAKDAGSAGAAIVNKFLRPAEEHRARREAEYTGGGGVAPAGPAPAGFGGLSVPQYSGPPIADLQAALMNPWLSAGEKQMAASMLDRAMQQGDPAYQLGLQKQQLEIAKLSQPERAKPMAINGQLIDPETGQVLGDFRDEAGGGGTEYGLSPQYGVDAEGNPTIIQIGKDGTAVETQMPDGVTFQKEPIRIDAGTEWVLLDPISRQPIGSIPKNLAEAEEQKAAGAATGKATAEASANLSTTISKADQAISLLRKIRDDPALPSITGMVQGRIQPLSQAGTDLNIKIEQAKGQVFLEAFQMLKGGGAITEMEGQKAEQAIARMNRAQSLAAYQAALNDMIAVIEAGKQRAAQKAGAPAEQPAGRRRYNPQTGEFE